MKRALLLLQILCAVLLTGNAYAQNITSLTPTVATAGNPGINLGLAGSGFCSQSSVTFGGAAVSEVFVNATQMTATIPANLLSAPGSAAVIVTNPAVGGCTAGTSNTRTFTIAPRPVLNGVTPNFAAAGGPQFTMSAFGLNFGTDSQVTWNGARLETTPVGPNQLNAVVPANLILNQGTAFITVITADNVQSTPPVQFTITPGLTITTSTLARAIVGVPYNQTLIPQGGFPPFTWLVVGGFLPQGLQLNPLTGVITGTPILQGTYFFSVRLSDSAANPIGLTASGRNEATFTRDFSLIVDPALISITPAALPGGTVNAAYAQSLTATGGLAPYSFLVSLGSLPPGLFLAGNGVLNGTPSVGGTYSFSVQASDSRGASAVRAYVVTIATVPLRIITETLPNGAPGVTYSQSLQAEGGLPGYTWSVVGGSLPAGLALDPSSGNLFGVSNSTGTFDFTVQVRDTIGQTSLKSYSLTIGQRLAITTASLPNGAVGVAYSVRLGATGGRIPYNWSFTGGALPSGLNLDSSGLLSGTPGAAGLFSFAVTVTDDLGGQATMSLDLRVNNPLSITTASLADATAGTAYFQLLAASGGTQPHNWAVTVGSLPNGMTLDSGTGQLGGIPTTPGTYNFTARVTDAGGQQASQNYTLVVRSTLTITTAALPDGTIGTAYSQQLAATGGAQPFTWSITQGTLPGGLTLNPATGAVTGTPNAAGVFQFTVRAADGNQGANTRLLSIRILLPALSGTNITGPDSANPATQPSLGFGLAAGFPQVINVTATITFRSDTTTPRDDQMVQFATGGRVSNFAIAANSALSTNLPVQVGTVAGDITITFRLQAGGQDITPTPAPTKVIRVARQAPTITSLRLVRVSGGFNLEVTGYSTPLDLSAANVTFEAAAGGNLQTTTATIALGPLVAAYYASAASLPFGSQLTVTLPFTFTGDASALGFVSVTETNSAGTSPPSRVAY